MISYRDRATGAKIRQVTEGPAINHPTYFLQSSFFPGDREMIYEVPRDDLFLIGTSEVSLAALHMNEILDPGSLPLRYAGLTLCSVFLIGLLTLPFAPETKGQGLPEE